MHIEVQDSDAVPENVTRVSINYTGEDTIADNGSGGARVRQKALYLAVNPALHANKSNRKHYKRGWCPGTRILDRGETEAYRAKYF